MMYPFMTLDDNTEVVHSEMLPDGRVKVYFEKPDAEDCFHSAVCYLPDYKWEDVNGFTPEEISGPTRTSRWSLSMFMWRRAHPAQTPPRYG